MKMLASPWVLALLGGVMSIVTTVALLVPAVSGIAPPARVHEAQIELPPRLWSFKTEAMDSLFKELAVEREKLATEQKNALAQQTQTAAEAAELEKKRLEIKALRDEINQRVVEIEVQEVKNLKTLAQTYSVMNPGAAVAILREMDENSAVKILATMKVDRVGPILGEMAKSGDRPGEETMARRAARISDKLRLLKTAPKGTS